MDKEIGILMENRKVKGFSYNFEGRNKRKEERGRERKVYKEKNSFFKNLF